MPEIYTDGSCRGSKLGAYGIVVVEEGKPPQIETDTLEDTTNNVMELAAMLLALVHVNNSEIRKTFTIYCDSEYVVHGLTRWLPGWRARGYKTAAGKAVKNVEVWKQLALLYDIVRDRVDIKWVRGHDGNKYNELIDKAVQARTKNP